MDAAPNLAHVLGSFDWHDQAACRDTAYPDDFFAEPFKSSPARDLTRGARLYPLLVCASCPVRRECLAEGLRTWRSTHDEHAPETVVRAEGVWGGSFAEDRAASAHLSADEALEVLEQTFPHRLGRRIAAWRSHPGRKSSRRDKLIAAMLASAGVDTIAS